MIIVGAVLPNYGNYNKRAQFANASEDVILELRQAQVYGVGVKKGASNCGGLGLFNCSYGIYFSRGANSIIMFADVDGNRVYGPGDEIVETVRWKNSITISELHCGLGLCTNSVSVTFHRPNPDAYITDIVPADTTVSPYNYASILLSDSATAETALIEVTSAGQISVN
jgi:hypothetical protein